MPDLFADDKIQEAITFYEHRRQCLHCYKWFETSSKYANRCPEHLNTVERKLIQKDYGPNDLPFKNFNRLTRKYE